MAINGSQQRILKLIFILAGHETAGLSLMECARAMEAGKDKVWRDLQNLRHAGLGEQLPDSDRWRLTPRLSQIGLAMMRNLDRQRGKLTEIENRYTRNPQ